MPVNASYHPRCTVVISHLFSESNSLLNPCYFIGERIHRIFQSIGSVSRCLFFAITIISTQLHDQTYLRTHAITLHPNYNPCIVLTSPPTNESPFAFGVFLSTRVPLQPLVSLLAPLLFTSTRRMPSPIERCTRTNQTATLSRPRYLGQPVFSRSAFAGVVCRSLITRYACCLYALRSKGANQKGYAFSFVKSYHLLQNARLKMLYVVCHINFALPHFFFPGFGCKYIGFGKSRKIWLNGVYRIFWRPFYLDGSSRGIKQSLCFSVTLLILIEIGRAKLTTDLWSPSYNFFIPMFSASYFDWTCRRKRFGNHSRQLIPAPMQQASGYIPCTSCDFPRGWWRQWNRLCIFLCRTLWWRLKFPRYSHKHSQSRQVWFLRD